MNIYPQKPNPMKFFSGYLMLVCWQQVPDAVHQPYERPETHLYATSSLSQFLCMSCCPVLKASSQFLKQRPKTITSNQMYAQHDWQSKQNETIN